MRKRACKCGIIILEMTFVHVLGWYELHARTSVGSVEDNKALSDKRIAGIQKYLQNNYNIDPSRVYSTRSAGESAADQSKKNNNDRKSSITLIKVTN